MRRPSAPEVALLAILAAGAASAGEPDDRRARQLTDLVRQDCGSCHGMTLKGGLGRPLLPEYFVGVPTEGMAAIILDGVPGTPMPPWRGLISEEEAQWIATKLKVGLPP